ncbi:hypothetical protein BGX28_004884 [Mortierella sp. GBA30]|nr:hypothetical protein BGX28_004884 [Mortierella sp. GBA30]
MSVFTPLRDDEWITSSSQKLPQSNNKLQPRLQQDRRQSQISQHHRTTTTVMRQTMVRQVRRPSTNNSSGSGSGSSNNAHASSSSHHSGYLVRQPNHLQSHSFHPRIETTLRESNRPPAHLYSGHGHPHRPISSSHGSSRQDRLPPGTGVPVGVWNAFENRFTPQDWRDWIKAQDKKPSASPTRMITTRPAQQDRGRPPPPVSDLAIRSPPLPPPQALPLNKPNGKGPIDDTVLGLSRIVDITGTSSSQAPSSGPSPARNPLSPQTSAFDSIVDTTPNGSESSSTSVPGSAAVVENLLELTPTEDYQTTITNDYIPEVVADLIDLDFSITTNPERDSVIKEPIVEDIASEDANAKSGYHENLDDQEDLAKAIVETQQNVQEIELIDFSEPRLDVQSATSPGEPACNNLVDRSERDSDAQEVLPNEARHVGSVDLTEPFSDVQSAMLHNELKHDYLAESSYSDTDSETDSDASEEDHGDPWTMLENGQILVELCNLDEVKSGLDRCHYTWDELITSIKI